LKLIHGFMICVGDHPGLCEIAGLKGPTSKVPSRHSMATKKELGVTGSLIFISFIY
jgi:hypothetical protein